MPLRYEVPVMCPLLGFLRGVAPGVVVIIFMITGLTVSAALTLVIWAHPVCVFITAVLVFFVVCA